MQVLRLTIVYAMLQRWVCFGVQNKLRIAVDVGDVARGRDWVLRTVRCRVAIQNDALRGTSMKTRISCV